MNLNDLVGRRITAIARGHDSPMGPTYAMQITFDDGSVLDINMKARYCDDAWLEFTFVESTETKAELDGLS